MDFLVVSDSKLKIVLTQSDMTIYNIDPKSSDCTDPLCRRAVFSILDLAKERVGFDFGGDKILVQFYPVKEGGCEVFVTKLGILSGTSAKIVSRSDRLALLSREKLLYFFDSLESLSLASKAIMKKAKAPPKSDVYRGEGDKYFLILEEYGKGGETSEFPSVLEFGKSLPADFLVYVLEHARKLSSGDGVEKFSKIS